MVNRVSRMWRRRHQGSAALITTIAISSILVVLFVGITSIATREIRQSIDADNSNRALYAAEAGVEDAMRRLAENPNFRELGCNSPTANTKGPEQLVGPVGANTAWTCRTVTTESAELTGKLDIDESLNINLGRARDASNTPRQPYSMVLEWNDPNDPSNSANPVMTGRTATWLPPFTSGGSNAWDGAAAMEITTTWFERTGGQVNASFANKGNLTGVLPVRTALASPSCGVGPCADISTWTNPGVSLGATNLRSNITTSCNSSPSREYSCTTDQYDLTNLVKAEINDGSGNVVYDSSAPPAFNTTNMFLRIRPRYNNASYRMRFYAQDGTQLLIPDGQATIDVTARSGDYYRRVIAKKQLQPSIMDGVFDNAIFSGANICKDLRIYRDYRGAPDFNTNVVPRTPNANAGKNTCDGNS